LIYEQINNPRGYSSGVADRRRRLAGALGELLLILCSFFMLPGYFPRRLVIGTRRHPPKPVLLVHGYSRNPLDFLLMMWRLYRDGYGPVAALRLSPVTGTIERFAWLTARELGRLDRPEYPPWTVICHSMGGVVTRLAMREFSMGKRIRLLVTLGSPHFGSKLAAFGLGKGIAQLRDGGGLLERLNQTPWELSQVSVLSIRSDNDELVLPSRSSELPPPAQNAALSSPGHLSLMWSGEAYRLIRAAEQQAREQSNARIIQPAVAASSSRAAAC